MPLIDLTDTELVHIMDSLRLRVADLRESPFGPELDDLANELEEIEHDLFEAFNRQDDGWDASAEAQFIQAGIDTREQQKATSRAAARRDLRTHTFHIERED
jgi:hypothetical protein